VVCDDAEIAPFRSQDAPEKRTDRAVRREALQPLPGALLRPARAADVEDVRSAGGRAALPRTNGWTPSSNPSISSTPVSPLLGG